MSINTRVVKKHHSSSAQCSDSAQYTDHHCSSLLSITDHTDFSAGDKAVAIDCYSEGALYLEKGINMSIASTGKQLIYIYNFSIIINILSLLQTLI